MEKRLTLKHILLFAFTRARRHSLSKRHHNRSKRRPREEVSSAFVVLVALFVRESVFKGKKKPTFERERTRERTFPYSQTERVTERTTERDQKRTATKCPPRKV